MIRVRTKNHRARFFRGGVEFGRGWLTLTESGDPGDSIDLTAEQAEAIRGEKRFLEVEEIDPKTAAKIVEPAKTSSGSSGQGVDPASKDAGESSGGKGRVNVNTASADQIAGAAQGIGKATARDLVKHRMAKGPFASLDDLTQVGGIGQATVDRNRNRLSV